MRQIFQSYWQSFNTWLTDRVSAAYSTVITGYVFTALSIVPLLVPAWMGTILYVSNAIQLDSMAFIGVSSAVGAANTMQLIRKIAAEIKEEFLILRHMTGGITAMHGELRQLREELRALRADLAGMQN